MPVSAGFPGGPCGARRAASSGCPPSPASRALISAGQRAQGKPGPLTTWGEGNCTPAAVCLPEGFPGLFPLGVAVPQPPPFLPRPPLRGRGGRVGPPGCSLAPSVGAAAGQGWLCCAGAAAQCPPRMLRCLCSPLAAGGNPLPPQRPPYCTPAAGQSPQNPGETAEWSPEPGCKGSPAPRHPTHSSLPASGKTAPEQPGDGGRACRLCRFPAPVQCSCDSQPWQMLMTEGAGMFLYAASSPHWKCRCQSPPSPENKSLGGARCPPPARRWWSRRRLCFQSSLEPAGWRGRKEPGLTACSA